MVALCDDQLVSALLEGVCVRGKLLLQRSNGAR
jgi:hypothetical protein